MARTPFARLFITLADVHAEDGQGDCRTCRAPIPCDTMRALWIYSLESRPTMYREG